MLFGFSCYYSLSSSVRRFWTDWKKLFSNFVQLLFEHVWPRLELLIWNAAMCAFNPCLLKINSNGGLKRQHLDSPSSATKTLYLQYHNAFNHQTWQGGELPWGAPIHKINYNSTTRVVMNTKTGRTAAHLDGLLPIKLHDSLIMWSCEIMWQTKYIISPLQCLWPRNLVVWWLNLKGS